MKTLLATILLFSGILLSGQTSEGTVDISVTTIEKNVGFHPKHVLAIWVEDDADSFIKTLKLRGDKRKQYLYTWNSASGGNKTDAITGATLSSHGTHSVSWDCTNTSGETVSDGDYTLFIEYTSEHSQGPLSSAVFTKAAESFSIQPGDVTYFKDMDITYTPAVTTGIENKSFKSQFTVYPNPASDHVYINLTLENAQDISLKVYSADMKLVKVLASGRMLEGEHTMTMDFVKESLSPGSYFMVLSGENRMSSRQIIIK